jgi:hypothetical protein
MKYFLIILLLLVGSTYTVNAQSDTVSTQPINLEIRGDIDAEKHYKKYKAAGTGTLITSLVSPIVGLVPAIATSASKPKITNLNYPSEDLFQQKEYYNSYTKRAKKIKQRKVWTNWAVGFGVNLLASVLIIKTLDNNGYF